MKALAELSSYEHPVHSMIIDLDDQVWKDYFTLAELIEIKSFNIKPLKNIPEELESYSDLYDKEWENGLDLYEFADSKKHHPIKEFKKNWIKESMIGVSELFFYQQDLVLNDYSESDLLHQLWQFIYRQFGDCSSRAMLSERCSVAVAIARNNDRSLEGQEKRQRKIMGAKLDILFKSGTDELGSCEVGNDCFVIVDDKYMDDGLVKLPKTLRDMLSALVETNPTKVNQFTTIGFLMMGLGMKLIRMDIPNGSSITRVLKTPSFKFPSCSKNIDLDFIRMLEIAWKGKQAMLDTVHDLNNRKRKVTELSVTVNSSVLLPQSFHLSS